MASSVEAQSDARSWREAVLDLVLRVGSIVLSAVVVVSLVLQFSPFTSSRMIVVVGALLVIALHLAKRLPFELRACLTVALFHVVSLLVLALTGFLIGAAALLVASAGIG